MGASFAFNTYTNNSGIILSVISTDNLFDSNETYLAALSTLGGILIEDFCSDSLCLFSDNYYYRNSTVSYGSYTGIMQEKKVFAKCEYNTLKYLTEVLREGKSILVCEYHRRILNENRIF